jgi:hypothetical protein
VANRIAKKTTGRKRAAKRELIDTGTDKRFVRRGAGGKFKESDDVGKSLAVDRRKKAKTKVKSGQGDKGDRSRESDARLGQPGHAVPGVRIWVGADTTQPDAGTVLASWLR